MVENAIIKKDDIQSRIYTIRNAQVMLDIDLAELYGVEVKRLNEQVKRNIERFPQEFSFQLTVEENNFLRSQFATLEIRRGGHRKYLPYAFTEQGVAMLSGVLKSKTAVQVSIQIINAFVTMRKFISANAQISKADKKVQIAILTKTISQQLALDVKKYNQQYPAITIREFPNSHDRFLIIDGKTVYHFGASLKDIGKKWFAFSKFDKDAFKLLERLAGVVSE
jgi:phage regulator Rha-like protein